MKKKILHIGEYIFGGGAESVLRDTVDILKAYDDENIHSVIVRNKKNEDKQSSDCFQFSNIRRGKVRTIISQIFSLTNFRKLNRVLNEFTPDIIHIQNYANLSPSILKSIYLYKKKKKVKVIHTVHTFEYVCSHHAGYDYRKERKCTDCSKNTYKYKIFYRGCSRLGYIHSFGKGIAHLIAMYYLKRGVVDQWITPSEFLKTKMHDVKFLENKIQVVRNPLVVSKGDFIKDKVNENLETFRFIYFGRFSEEKNIECIVNAFSLLLKNELDNAFELVLIGSGEKENGLKELVSTLGIESRVKFFGFMNKENLYKAIQKCNVSIMSSKCYENAPLVLLESILNDLVPIAVDHGGMKEMIEKVDFGFTFRDDDEKDLSEKMYAVYKSYNQLIHEIPKKKHNLLNEFGSLRYFNELKRLY